MPVLTRAHIRLTAAVGCVALLAGCTPAGGAVGPTIRRPNSTTKHRSASTTGPSRSPEGARGQFTIAFAGDVHFAGRVGDRLAADPATVFGPAAPGLARADLTMVNLETAITTGGDQQNKLFTFRAPPAAFTALRDAGVDLATMANNHGADYGETGLHDSLAASRAAHFPVVGIGANVDAAFAPYTTSLNRVKVAIFAADQVRDETTLSLFSAGPGKAGVANAYDPRLVSEVRTAKNEGFVVVVYVHWGIEYQTCPSADQQLLARELADAGATAVIGAHAHVLQGAGWRKDGTYVAYGLGNYLWWRSFGNDQDDNGVLTLNFDRDTVTRASFAPSHLDDRGVPVPAVGAEKRRIAGELAADRSCTDLAASPPH